MTRAEFDTIHLSADSFGSVQKKR